MAAATVVAPKARGAAARRDTCLREKTGCSPISAQYFPGLLDDSKSR